MNGSVPVVALAVGLLGLDGGCESSSYVEWEAPSAPLPPLPPPPPGPVNPLQDRPIPPDDALARAMLVWIPAVPAQDPLASDAGQQGLIDFCGARGCNVLALEAADYLGAQAWGDGRVVRLRRFLDAAHRSGIRVYALMGGTGLAASHQWVMTSLVEPLVAFNAMAVQSSERFDGVLLEVDYWSDEARHPPSVHLPGLCDLVRAVRSRTDGLPVGCRAASWLKDGTGGRPLLSYGGKEAQDGEHLMDVCDFVLVGAHRDHAAFGGSENGPGQIELSQPWYDYAKGQGRNIGLLIGSETTDVLPAYATYHGLSKARMEAEHGLVAGHLKAAADAAFIGQSVNCYSGWKEME